MLQLAASNDSTRFNITGVKFEKNVAVATDGHILAVIQKDGSTTAEDCIIAFDKAKQKSKQMFEVYTEVGNAVVGELHPTNTAVALPPETEFPNWRAIIPARAPKHIIKLDAAILLRLAQALGANPKQAHVTIEFDESEDSPMIVQSIGRDASVNAVGIIMPIRSEVSKGTGYERLKRLAGVDQEDTDTRNKKRDACRYDPADAP